MQKADNNAVANKKNLFLHQIKAKNEKINLSGYSEPEEKMTDDDLSEIITAARTLPQIKIKELDLSHNNITSFARVIELISLFDQTSPISVNVGFNQINLKSENLYIAKTLPQLNLERVLLNNNGFNVEVACVFFSCLIGFSGNKALASVKVIDVSSMQLERLDNFSIVLQRIMQVFPELEEIIAKNNRSEQVINQSDLEEFINQCNKSKSLRKLDFINSGYHPTHFKKIDKKITVLVENENSLLSEHPLLTINDEETTPLLKDKNQNKAKKEKSQFNEKKGYNAFIYHFMHVSVLFPNYPYPLPNTGDEGIVPSNTLRSFILTQFIKGFKFGTGKVWPAIVTALLLNDVSRYYLYPHDRYGTTLADIFSGTATNQRMLSNHWGSDIVTDIHFSLWITLTALAPVSTGALNLGMNYYRFISNEAMFLKKAFNNLETQEKREELLKKIGERKSRLNTIVLHYQLWTLGEIEDKKWRAAFSAFTLTGFAYVLYTWARLGESMVRKIIATHHFFQEKAQCEAQSQLWRYMQQVADYECTVCGDWPFVYYNNLFSAQGCLDDLFKQPFNSTQILKFIDRIYLNNNFKNIDLSRVNWPAWPEHEWQTLLNRIKTSISALDTFNLSMPMLDPIFPQDKKMQMLADFFEQVAVKNVEARNLNAGRKLYPIFSALNHSNSQSLIFDGNGLLDTDLVELRKYAYPSLRKLGLKNNPIGDYGIRTYFNPPPSNSSLTHINLSGNLFNQAGMDALGEAMPQLPFLEELDLSGIDLNHVDLHKFGEGLTKAPQVKKINLSSCNLTDEHILTLIAYIKNSGVIKLILRDNFIADEGIVELVMIAQNGVLEIIDLSDNIISDLGLENASPLFESTQLKELHIAQNAYSSKGFSCVIKAIPGTTIEVLDVSDNLLGEAAAEDLAECLNNPHTNLTSINASGNNFGEQGGLALIKSFPQSKLKEVCLANNNFTPQVGEEAAALLPESQIRKVDLSNNLLDNDSGKELARQAKKAKWEKLHLDNNPMGAGIEKTLAEQLISPLPNSENIGKAKLSMDQKRAIAKAKPATTLNDISMKNTGADEQDEHALCQVGPSANLQPEQMGLDNCQFSSASSTAAHSILHQLIATIKHALPDLSPMQTSLSALAESTQRTANDFLDSTHSLAADVTDEEVKNDAIKAGIYLLLWASYFIFRYLPRTEQPFVYHDTKSDRFKKLKQYFSYYQKVLILQKQSHAGKTDLFQKELELIEIKLHKIESKLKRYENKTKISEKNLNKIEHELDLIRKKIHFISQRNKALKKLNIKILRKEEKFIKNNRGRKQVAYSNVNFNHVNNTFEHQLEVIAETKHYFTFPEKNAWQPTLFKPRAREEIALIHAVNEHKPLEQIQLDVGNTI